MSTARDLCRQHGSPYIRPSARRERAEGWACAFVLAACLTVPAALFDTEEPDMQPNLNAPALEQGPLTAEELAAYNRSRLQDAWADPDTLPSPLFPAECCTEIDAEPKGQHRTGFLSVWWLRLKRALA